MSPQRPSEAELQVCQEIRTKLQVEGMEIGTEAFNRQFQHEWLQVCRDMALGKREETHIGLIAGGALAPFLKMYQRWTNGARARKAVREVDDPLRAELRAREGGTTLCVGPYPNSNMPLFDGGPTTSQDPNPMETVSRTCALTRSNFTSVSLPSAITRTESASYDPTRGATQVTQVTQQVASGDKETIICFACGWPMYGEHPVGGRQKHKRGGACQVDQGRRNPNLKEERRARSKAYKLWCKRTGNNPDL